MRGMMNLVSMTGRGTGVADGPIGRAEAELSSVNRKQLDVNLSLPRELAFAEADLVRLVLRRVARGHVGGELRVTRAEGASACLKIKGDRLLLLTKTRFHAMENGFEGARNMFPLYGNVF